VTDDGEPIQTGISNRRSEAIQEAKDWAYVEQIEYRGPDK
jgi:hypothetical protein